MILVIIRERVVVFIDGSNFYHGLKANFGRTRVDFYKFAASLCGDNRKLIRIYYYNVPFKKEIDEEKYKSQNAVKDRGKHVEHAYFKAASSVALRKACDKYTTLNDDFLSSCFI